MNNKTLPLLVVVGVLALGVAVLLSRGLRTPISNIDTTAVVNDGQEALLQDVSSADLTSDIDQELSNVELDEVDPMFVNIDADLQKL